MKKSKKLVCLCHGVYDMVHVGHINQFKYIKKNYPNCELVVSITDQKYVNKGPNRPFFNNDQRLEILSNIKLVDRVYLCEAETAIPAINYFKPDFYFKDIEYKNHDITNNISKEKSRVEFYKGRLIYTNEASYSSSTLINDHFDNLNIDLKKILVDLKKKYLNSENILKQFNNKNKKVLLIGETIFDSYINVLPQGKSAKENLINNLYFNENIYCGGIIATANNIASANIKPTLITLLNTKDKLNLILKKKIEKSVKKKFFYSNRYQNINKIRFVDKSYGNRKIFEVTKTNLNFEFNTNLNKIYDYLKKNIKKYDMIIINDFGHGLINDKIIKLLNKNSSKLFINCQSNSLNYGFNLITKYKKANYITLDLPESQLAINEKNSNITDIFKKLRKKIKYKQAVITSSSKGCYYMNKKKLINIPAISNKVLDTVGSGDAFFAFSSLIYGYFNDVKLASLFGNIGGSIKIKILGHERNVKFIEILKAFNTMIK